MPKTVNTKVKPIALSVARGSFIEGEAGGAKSAAEYAAAMDHAFAFNWTMRADGKFDQKANSKLSKDEAKVIRAERDECKAAYLATVPGADDIAFNNRWDYLKRLSTHRVADEKAKKEKAKKSERELYLNYLRLAYNKASEPESQATQGEIDLLKDACKLAGLDMNEV
jgi:hypothetical protein